ncbi:MAG: prephenate dehydratase [Pirellulales bacterium]|nr:prephenate dehydratase [Pirellulales bacterium]
MADRKRKKPTSRALSRDSSRKAPRAARPGTVNPSGFEAEVARTSNETCGPKVSELRRELEAVDREILAAINRRGELARQIGHAKQAEEAPLYDPGQEAAVLDRATASNTGPLPEESVRVLFRELVSATRALQTPIRVAYLGPEFTFSHLAAIERFGQSVELVPVGTIAAVFEEVQRGQVEYGVVPMENSTDGRVTDTLEGFSRSTVRICGELPLRIHHCLLGVGSRDAIRTICSKPQPLSQCRNWLAKHLPQATLAEVGSTATAVQQAKGESHAAAIASRQAGVHYGLPCLVENIEDNTDNITRFAMISRHSGSKTGNDKTALMVEIAHRPGALADAMTIFKRNKLNMTWIESFPIPGQLGRYLFFIAFEGHQDDPRARRAIEALASQSLRLTVLGSYAQTDPVG